MYPRDFYGTDMKKRRCRHLGYLLHLQLVMERKAYPTISPTVLVSQS